MRFLLSVAGFDPSGGAGIVRDILTFSRFGFYGCSVITANTAQNTKGVEDFVFQDGSFLLKQLDLLLEEFDFSGVKFGLSHSSLWVNEEVSERVKGLNVPVVLDPVISPTLGRGFIEEVDVLKPLISAATVVTPNVDEFGKLDHLLRGFDGYVVVKGIVEGESVKDLLMKGGEVVDSVSHTYEPKKVRGTGCAFSSSFLCFLAEGFSVREAFRKAAEYLEDYRRRAFKTEKMKQSLPL